MSEEKCPAGADSGEDLTHTLHGDDQQTREGHTPTAGGDTARMPDSIGPFRILGVLGKGGMGVVYEAEQDQPKRRVALKIIRGGSFADETQVRMFQREADALARLKHPGIGAIHQVGKTDEGQPYFVMELIRGKPLDQYLANKPAPASSVEMRHRLRLFSQICDAVHYAHQRGIIHRDLKPSNILVIEPDANRSTSSDASNLPQTKILDFGLARIIDSEATEVTEIGMIKGTLQYMSPEQAQGLPENIDIRADVYALGALLYEILSGKRPYNLKEEALAEAVRIICEKSPEPLGSTWKAGFRPDPDIETIVGKALEKDPDRRYASVAAFSDDIERYVASQPILARPPSAVYQLRKMVTRHRAIFGIAAASIVLIIAAAVISTALYFRAERAAERARIEAEKSKEVASFMTEMLESVGPAVARGQDTAMLRGILDATVERIDDELGGSPEVAQVLQSRIAQTYFDLSELQEAERLYRSALEKSLSTHGPDHVDTLAEMNSLAVVLAATDKLEESENLYKQALERRRRVLEEGHPDIGATLLYLANLYYNQSRNKEAEPLYMEAVELLRTRYPEGDRVLGIALNSLGNFYHSLARYDDAEALYREALQMHTRQLGADHPDVLVDMHNLAYLLRNCGDLEQAESMFLGILETQHRIFGEDHRNIATVIGSLGAVRKSMGDFTGAETRYREALAMTGRLMGEDSESYGHLLNELAVVVNLNGDPETAEALYRQALATQGRVLGKDSDQVATTRGNLASILIKAKRFDEAAEQLNESIRVLQGLYGAEHPRVLIVLNDLGALHRARGNPVLAEKTIRQVLETRLRTLGGEHAQVGRSQYDLARLLIEIGGDENIAEGEQLLRESITTYIAAKGEAYPAVPIVRIVLGRQLMSRKEFAEAEKLMLSGHTGVVKAYGPDHPRVAKAASRLVELYEDWGKPAEAEKWSD